MSALTEVRPCTYSAEAEKDNFLGKQKKPHIDKGETAPNVELVYFNDNREERTFFTHEVLKGKRVLVITLPGAETRICSQQYPDYAKHALSLKKYVDAIVLVAINTINTLEAWQAKHDPKKEILLWADSNREFTAGTGLGTWTKRLGIHCERSVALYDDCKVVWIHKEAKTSDYEFKAEVILTKFQKLHGHEGEKTDEKDARACAMAAEKS